MKKIFYHVLEDNEKQKELLLRLINDVSKKEGYKLAEGVVSSEAEEFIKETAKYNDEGNTKNIFFLDHVLDELDETAKTGIEVGRLLNYRSCDNYIVLVTSHTKSVLRGHKELGAFHFIQKENLNFEEVRFALYDFRRKKDENSEVVSDIILVQKENDILKIYYDNHTSKQRKSLTEFISENDSNYFFKCNKTELVNLRKISNINEQKREITLINGMIIVVSVRKWVVLKKVQNL